MPFDQSVLFLPKHPSSPVRSSKWGVGGGGGSSSPGHSTTGSAAATSKFLIGGCDDLGLTPEERCFNAARSRLVGAQMIGALLGRLAESAPLTPTDASPHVALAPLCQLLTFYLDVANSRSSVQK